MDFHNKLALNKYIFSLFGCKDFDDFLKKEPTINTEINLERVDEQGISLFHQLISSKFAYSSKISQAKLLEYDNNIVSHTKKFKRPIVWKYFQYLTLLFTEIYLDMYFTDKKVLLDDLNTFLNKFNEDNKKELKKNTIEKFKLEELNKLAFWNATGSGKTLLMHINTLQHKHYSEKHNHKINKTLLITPNEGLSNQHLEEFNESGISAEIFNKDGNGLFSSNCIEIIEVTKLGEESKDKTVAVDSFGDDNLVFIDEAHRGSGGDTWKKNRDKLYENGFAFEYSATFGQAVNSATATAKTALEREYSKSILFDYSYKYFYNDGFGKDYTILNLDKEPEADIKYNYLIGAILSFYQQKKIYQQNTSKMKEYNIHNPLMLFVGGKVSVNVNKEEGSDITNVLKFFEEFIDNKTKTIQAINNILQNKSGINISSGVDIFTNKFDYLISLNQQTEDIYDDILKLIFQGNTGKLQLDELKGQDGEIGLRLGDNDYFGVINIGITSEFKKLCEEQKLILDTRDFSHSLFKGINKDESKINFLIGSRKFSEGWSSWRVSSMGLLNMGKNEGSQVIQLFGRGVRLKGKEMSLKRSTHHGETLDTKFTRAEQLNIFGLRADYMKAFNDYLKAEGAPSGQMLDFILPTIKDTSFKGKGLKVLRLQAGRNYKSEEKVDLQLAANTAITKKVVVNFYAKAEAIGIIASEQYATELNTHKFTSKDFAFVNMDKVFLELVKYKNERNYYNLSINKSKLEDFKCSHIWYKLQIPSDYFKIIKFEDYKKIEDVFIALLKKYVDEFYKFNKNDWEKDKLEYVELKEDDNNFVDEYKITVEDDAANSSIIQTIKNLQKELKSGKVPSSLNINYFKSFSTNKHLYNPLLCKDTSALKISPVELNQGEMKFAEDLEDYLSKSPSISLKDENDQNIEINLAGENIQIYLLRNKSKSGIGFFEDGGFYPDFILWIIKNGIQYINFCDPKGIRNLDPHKDPKMNFHKSIKAKETALNDSTIKLNSFIVSNTEFIEVQKLHSTITKIQLENKNVLFQEYPNYIEQMFIKIFC